MRRSKAIAVLATTAILCLPTEASADPSETFMVRFGQLKCQTDGTTHLRVIAENGYGILHWSSSIPTKEGRYVHQKRGKLGLYTDRTVKRLTIKPHKALYVRVYDGNNIYLSGTRLAKECNDG